jgi:hypothetical protein
MGDRLLASRVSMSTRPGRAATHVDRQLRRALRATCSPTRDRGRPGRRLEELPAERRQ